MSRIYGDKDAIAAAKRAKPGDKKVYINFDAINELPEEFEVVVSKIEFDPKNLDADFSDVGNGHYMPQPQLMYRIAEAKGIRGCQDSITEPVIEEVDINPLLMKGLGEQPIMRKMCVGRKVSKQSKVVEEDGTERSSSLCTCIYNVWERCKELWSREEMDTNGYDDKIVKTGEYEYFGKKKYGPHYKKGQYVFEIKYNLPLKRQLHFDSEMKFAHAKAETKAHEKTIRELAGLMTGYKKNDLSEGKLYFAKVRRSREILKAESAARLSALSKGKQIEQKPQVSLFGPGEIEEQITQVNPVDFPVVEEKKESILKDKPKWEQFIEVINHYSEENIIPTDIKKSVEKAFDWVFSGKEKAEEHTEYWEKAINILRALENDIPKLGKIEHNLY